jgi:hypothetical protein
LRSSPFSVRLLRILAIAGLVVSGFSTYDRFNAVYRQQASRGGSQEHRVVLAEDEGQCHCYKGEMWGNDNDVSTRLELCQTGGDFSGTLSWSSPRSGRSVRRVSGRGRGTLVELHDDMLTVNEPIPPWTFCLINQYTLRLLPKGGLAGNYWSSLCQDRAEVQLNAADDEECEQLR